MRKLLGVASKKADYPTETVRVSLDPAATSLDDIRSTIGRAGYRTYEAAAEPLPFGENGGASGVGAFAGNRLQGALLPKLGGRCSEARRGGEAPSALFRLRSPRRYKSAEFRDKPVMKPAL
ncbi:hypothetical protein D1O30_19430 [Methylocystis hirsuta]|uniref:HMA domain-containing protein n=1 Tax=Methylocystis hirsuta TaxID=369798 RepID=A0A3M9XK80_9HYPH|nr:hypothetical protein D1O30_19430 [Methylocystis hirsuta]